MGISKVILNGVTKVDLTQDTVAANNLLSGETATGADGEAVEGAIAGKSSTDLTVSGATVTAPAGFYSEAASKSVSTTTHPNPTASINSTTGVVTASHTQGTGYVAGGTTTGTLSLSTQAAKTVTPTEEEQTAVAAGKYTTGVVKVGAISSTYVGSDIPRRTYNDMTVSARTVTAPAGYYASNSSKSVAIGSITTPDTTITANPSISVDATGLVTATVSGSSTVEPTVSDGYVTSNSATSGDITVSGSDTLQLSTQGTKTVTPTESSQTAVAAGKYTTGTVTVGAIPSTYVGSDIPQNDSDDLTASGATVTAPAGYYAEDASKSIANASLGGSSTSYAYGSENLEITRSYPNFQPGYMASMDPVVNTMTLENKTVTPSETKQIVTPTSSGYVIRKVTVGAIPSTYVGSGIPKNDSDDLAASGATVIAPAGYYASNSSKSVALGSAGTPIATKGTVSNNSVSVTPSVTNTSGYISSGGTLTGTPVTVSASELVSGTKRITTNGTGIDVMNYASVEVDVRALWVNMGTISSLPVTKTLTGITTDMICAKLELGTPSAQTETWTIDTDTADEVTITGTISGSTTCKLLLVQSNSDTAS